MKTYGLPRTWGVANPDVADIRGFALKSCVGSIPKDNNEYRGIIKNKEAKANRRRSFKKCERRSWKKKKLGILTRKRIFQ